MKKETFNITAGALFVVALLAVLIYLISTPIPSGNKDVVLTLTAALIGGMTTVMPKVFGISDPERDAEKRELQTLKETIKVLEGKYNVLRREHDRLLDLLVERHIIHGHGISVPGKDPVTEQKL